mmetsp:Transcript_24195/g.35843  ORF Transcript_24195/g.35843 Transcript_24195/m.35843 type:complete len:234 (-) Transcript_24195:278-979(-)
MAQLPLNKSYAGQRRQQQQNSSRAAVGGNRGIARRVSFAHGSTSASLPKDLGRYNNDTSSSDEDEANEDEEATEQERILSERFGEAGEAPVAGGTKRKATDNKGEDEDRDFLNATSGAAGGNTAKKRSRPNFTPSDLIGSRGLIRIKNEFSKIVKRYRVPPSSKPTSSQSHRDDKQRRHDREREAAASFGQSLIGSYRMFCRDLCPSLAFEDVLGRIEMFGSKKEVMGRIRLI